MSGLDSLPSWLLRPHPSWEDRPCIGTGEGVLTFRQLFERRDAWTRRVRSAKLRAGTVVAFQGDFSAASVSLLLALAENRMVSLPLAAEIPFNAKEGYFRLLEHVVWADLQTGDFCPLERKAERTAEGLELLDRLIESNHPGLIVFSSGITGQPKGILHDLLRLTAKFEIRRRTWTTMLFLALDHVGGINTLFSALSNGGFVVVPESRRPDAVCQAIERYAVELLPTTPTFLNLLLMSSESQHYNLASLKLVTYGTEVMAASTLARLTQRLPGVRISQTYGLSELGILRAKSRSQDSLFVKIGGEGYEVDVRDGILWIRAASSMLGYLNAPSPFDHNGWFNTQDVVIQEGDYFRILGRASDVINVAGEKVFPAEVESVVAELPEVTQVAVHGEPHPITGSIVVAAVCVRSDATASELRQRIRDHCRARLEPFKVPVRILIRDHLSITHRYKKQRND